MTLWLVGATLPPSCRALFPLLRTSGQILNTAFFRIRSQALLPGLTEICLGISTTATGGKQSRFIARPRSRLTEAVDARISRDA